jgi:hypothetical protein
VTLVTSRTVETTDGETPLASTIKVCRGNVRSIYQGTLSLVLKDAEDKLIAMIILDEQSAIGLSEAILNKVDEMHEFEPMAGHA